MKKAQWKKCKQLDKGTGVTAVSQNIFTDHKNMIAEFIVREVLEMFRNLSSKWDETSFNTPFGINMCKKPMLS